MGTFILEVCVDSVESAIAAVRGGADRLEVCSNLVIGGTTPGISLFQQIRKSCDVALHVLLRPRYGDFLYTDREFQMIAEDGKRFLDLGADGIVAGCLNPDGSLDLGRMKQLRALAGKHHVTLHRAFDLCLDPERTLEEAVDLGVDTILTSGQEESCIQGKELLGRLIRQAGERGKCRGNSRPGWRNFGKGISYVRENNGGQRDGLSETGGAYGDSGNG